MSRSFAVSIDVIKAGLIERIDTLVPELFPNARREGHEWVLGDIHGAPGKSLAIHRTGTKAGWWKDFSGTAKGDILDLFAAGACDGDVKAAIPKAVEYLGLGHLSEGERRERERRAEQLRARRAEAQANDAEAMRRRARGHWHGAKAIEHSPADRYLLGRGIDIRRLPKIPGSLRFKPMRCPEFSREGAPVMRPCMLATVNHAVTGEQLAVHRTFLHLHPDGRVTKADKDPARPMAQPKRALGEFAGGFIPLARGASGRPINRAPAGEILVLSEGIEDGLSVALAMPKARVGAALSLSNLGGIVLPCALAGVTVAGQRDTKRAAIDALGAARRRLAERGIMHRLALPPEGTKDWNDWLQALARGPVGEADRGAA